MGVHKHSNVVVYGVNIPNSIRSYNNNYKNLNAKAMEDALEHVGISPQVSSSLINAIAIVTITTKMLMNCYVFPRLKALSSIDLV